MFNICRILLRGIDLPLKCKLVKNKLKLLINNKKYSFLFSPTRAQSLSG